MLDGFLEGLSALSNSVLKLGFLKVACSGVLVDVFSLHFV